MKAQESSRSPPSDCAPGRAPRSPLLSTPWSDTICFAREWRAVDSVKLFKFFSMPLTMITSSGSDKIASERVIIVSNPPWWAPCTLDLSHQHHKRSKGRINAATVTLLGHNISRNKLNKLECRQYNVTQHTSQAHAISLSSIRRDF